MVRERARARDLGKQSGYRIKRGGDTERSWAEGTQLDGEDKEGFCSPPPWRVWASGELRRLWREKTGAVHGTDPNSSTLSHHRHPGPQPGRCAVFMCKLSCHPIPLWALDSPAPSSSASSGGRGSSSSAAEVGARSSMVESPDPGPLCWADSQCQRLITQV